MRAKPCVRPLGSTVTVLTAALLASSWVAARDLNRQSVFEKAVEYFQKGTQKNPRDPGAWYNLAKEYADEARLNVATLPRDVVERYVRLGLENNERALALNPVYIEALTLQDSLLRQRAASEGDAAVRDALLKRAAVARATADAIERTVRANRAAQGFFGP